MSIKKVSVVTPNGAQEVCGLESYAGSIGLSRFLEKKFKSSKIMLKA